MNIDNWIYCYKIKEDGNLANTNMLYTPLMSPDGKILCMSWDENSPYQENKKITKELLDFFFQREVKYIQEFQSYSWAPKLYEIDELTKKIFFEWNSNSINAILTNPLRNLYSECPDWKDQIYQILKDIVDAGYYKMALYPHCFFLDKNNRIKTFDFYSTVSIEEKYLELSNIEGIIGPDSVERFKESSKEGFLDVEMFFKNTMQSHLGKSWKDNPFPDFYQKLIQGMSGR